MNAVDRFWELVSPQVALKREAARIKLNMVRSIQNSGYDEGGASTKRNAMKGWYAESLSPQEDIDLNLNTLRQRSRSLFMTAPLATSAIKTNRTNVVGAGLKLKSRVDFKALGISHEAAD